MDDEGLVKINMFNTWKLNAKKQDKKILQEIRRGKVLNIREGGE